MENDVVEEYKSSLSDLNCNSKPMINALTIIAEENIKFATQVVQVIENHINNATPELKLPVLYLIDSIMKNVGREYLGLFSERIVSIFSSVFEKVDEKTRFLLYKLRQTWTEIMPNNKLYAIDYNVSRMDPAWPITSQPPVNKSTKGTNIHINPKFLTASAKKPEDSVAIRELEAKRKAQVLKQLLAKQERIRESIKKEPEKKNNTSSHPVAAVCSPKSSEAVPVERRELQSLDPRIVQRDPRLKKNSVSSGIPKGLDEDKSIRNVSPVVQNQQCPPQKQSALLSMVVIPKASSSQSEEADVSSKNGRKCENSAESSKKKTDKATPLDVKNSSEQTKSDESKSVKRFPSPQKSSSELPHQNEIQDKTQRGQDSSRKTKADASASKKSSASKEKLSNSDSKQPSDNKSSAPEKTKSDIKDPHVESVKHSGRPSKGSPQPSLLEAEKDLETVMPRSRSRVAAESKKNSPRHRSRSPLHDEDKRKDNKPSRTRSARHLPMQKADGEKVEKAQEPAGIKNSATSDFPKVDTDLRVSSRSSASPEKNVKGSKRDTSAFIDVENQENVHEPPVKRVRDEKENENSENVSWFGNQDQDYRCKERENKNNSHQGWAQYKAVHPDEFKSPLRPARENMENIGPGGQNFRDNRDALLPKHSQSEQHQFGGVPGSFESEYDKLGRPRLYRRRSYDMRFRGRHGRRYDQLPQRENFYYGQNDKDCDVTSMLSNPQYIIRQAEAKFHAGLIDEVCYRDIRGGLQKMMDSARKLGIRMPSFNVSSTYPSNKFLEHGEYPGSRMRQIPVPPAAVRAKGPRPPPPITCSFKLDAKMRVVYFVDDKAIVEIDGVPKQIVLKGQPTAVYIEGLDPITVNFDGKPVEFDVDGEVHSLKFGVPKRELYVDDYPYEGEFDGPPFVVDIGVKPHSVRLGGPPPTAVILNKLPHDLYQKFLSVHRSHCSNATSPIAEKDAVEDSTVPNYPVKTEDTDFRGGEDERTASNTASGSVSSDVDMRTAVKKEPADCERSGNFDDAKYAEIGTNSDVSDMKDVDWRCHPLPPDSAPTVRNDGNYLPPPNVDFSSLKDSCRSADSLPDPKLHSSLSRNQIMHSEVEPKFRSTFTESAPQMHQNVWNGPAHDTSDDRSQNSSDWHDWENSQDRVMTWQECGPRHPQAPVQLHDRPVSRLPNWSRGGRFTPPYAQKEPVDCILPPHGITPQQPNWRQPLETMNESKPNMPGWDWKQRGYRPDVPPVRPHPSDQGHPYSMQRNDAKPPFESYRGPYEQLPPPPMPPRGPLHLMGNQLRPDMSVPMLRPTIPSSDMRNSRPLMLPQRQWLPRNPIESNLPPSIREQRPLLKFPHPIPPVSGLPSNPPLRTTLPPPPLPPNLPNIPVSLQGTVTFNMPRVPSPVVSEMSHTEPVTSQSYAPSFSGPEVPVKTEVVDTSVSSQGILPTVNTGSQQLTSQIVQPVTSQGNSVTAPSQDTGTSTATDAAPSSSTAPPNVLDLTALMERLIAAGIITTKPSQEKMEVVEPEAKTGNENVDKEEPTPPIEFTTESLKGRYPGVISALFKGTQCASCGMRFKDTHGERYKRHLDWHFRVNRREKDGAKKAFSRKWYYDVDDWIQFEEFEDFEERARSFFELQADEELLQAPAVIEVPTVPAARGHETEVCVVCGEAFQLLWVEEEEEWHLKDAVREDGQPYHPLCFEDFKKASEVPDTPVDEVPPVETSAEKEEDSAEMDTTAVPEDAVPKDDVKTESAETEETKVEENASVKQETAEDTPTVSEEETVKVKEEPVEEEPLEGKPGEEEIIGVITESDMEEEEKEPPKESKMVVLQSGGIVVKVRAESIQQPASPAPAAPTDKDADQKKEEDSEEEFRPPTPDPRFKVLPPVKKGTELSGLCSIM